MNKKMIWLLVALALCLAVVLLAIHHGSIATAGLFGIFALIITSVYATEANKHYGRNSHEKS